MIAGKAAIALLLHISQGKHKYRAVFCHWLDGYIPDVSGQTDISVKKLKNSAKNGGEENNGARQLPRKNA